MGKISLTLERLNLEYLSWKLKWDNGRDNDNRSFGMYLENKYKMSEFRTYHLSESFILCDSLYDMLLGELNSRVDAKPVR